MSQIIASAYEILQEIGAGAGGVVYLGRHLRLDKPIALKADKRKLSLKPETLRREVDALKNLNHTYIPQVYDFVSDGETVYTVMDYIEGKSFDKLIRQGTRFSQTQIVEWACQILEALCYLHNRPPYGILHGDIKPANVMLRPEGDICLIDYNIALALGEDGAMAVGRSPGYASPEHYHEHHRNNSPSASAEDGASTITDTPAEVSHSARKTVVLDARSDIYSLGATLYHLLTGRRPAKDAANVTALSKRECSALIADIINKAMNPNPDMRYQTAEEMLFDFTHLHENDPRAKKLKRNQLIVGISLTAIFLTGGFTSFIGLKQMERIQAARTLSEYSANALNEGDAPLAAAYALEALREDGGIFAWPRISQAQKALTDALGVYDLTEGYKPFNIMTLPGAPLKIALSPDGKKAVVLYAYEAAIIDTESAAVTARLPAVPSALADVEFVGGTMIAYAGETGICLYDLLTEKTLWSGAPATEIAVSADGQTIAAVFKDESNVLIYGADGKEKISISFEGRGQRIAFNDTFANPNDNLLALNQDGSMLAASFTDGSLRLFDLTRAGHSVELLTSSEFTHFEGGFSGIYFAFSGAGQDTSVFAVVDTREMAQTGGFTADGRFGVLTDKARIFLSSENVLVKFNPVDGKQEEAAFVGADILAFDCDARNVIVAASNNGYAFFDQDAVLISEYKGDSVFHFVDISGDYAIVGGRDTPVLRILKRDAHEDAVVFSYESGYVHDEARINEDRTRVTLFSHRGFRLYDMNGNLLREVAIPEPDQVYDQQYSAKSGNLAVIYQDALRIYSGESGEMLFEREGLKSVFYTHYGVSMLERNGTLSLIAVDTAALLQSARAQGEFAAFCGMVVDDAFLGGQSLLGAAQIEDGHVFAVGGTKGALYDGSGNKLFDMAMSEDCEVFFTDNLMILSPLHGTPQAYSLKTGKRIRELEKDAYLTYVTSKGEHIITEYISADGERFGMLLDAASCETLAYLPKLSGVTGDSLLFDDKRGKLRQSRIFSIEELIALAEQGGGKMRDT